ARAQRRTDLRGRSSPVPYFAGGGRRERGQNGQKRGLAGAIRPQEAHDSSGTALHGHARQRAAAPVIPREIPNRNVEGTVEGVGAHAARPWPPSVSRSR